MEPCHLPDPALTLWAVLRRGRKQDTSTFDPGQNVLVLRTSIGAFRVTYRCAAPGRLARTARTTWSTPKGTILDRHQHVIEIESGAHLLSFGWRGDGPTRSGLYHRGLWEFEFLKAVGLLLNAPPLAQQMLASPFASSRWQARGPIEIHHFDRQVLAPFTYAVLGCEESIIRCVEPGTRRHKLDADIWNGYCLSHEADGMERRENGRTTTFGLFTRQGRRRPGLGTSKASPGFKYWIESDSIPLAVELLIRFDHDTNAAPMPPLAAAA
jgi:hypothetical protein